MAIGRPVNAVPPTGEPDYERLFLAEEKRARDLELFVRRVLDHPERHGDCNFTQEIRAHARQVLEQTTCICWGNDYAGHSICGVQCDVHGGAPDARS